VLLLFYSLFVEIPFTATYAQQGVGDALITTGTYALTRHPGVLWFGLWMAGLVLVTRGQLLLAAGIVWTLLDAVYVWLQEVFLFRRMFPSYAAYQRTTPMLVPTPQSVARCLRTWPRRVRAVPGDAITSS
jgi:protein-S-isoprenylcysteine O-methyltransferase Ste14